jgi:hypothetical protein
LARATPASATPRAASTADVRALLANPERPTAADCAALDYWLASTVEPSARLRFENLAALRISKFGGGAAAVETARMSTRRRPSPP